METFSGEKHHPDDAEIWERRTMGQRYRGGVREGEGFDITVGMQLKFPWNGATFQKGNIPTI